jgi:hypothetical protein
MSTNRKPETYLNWLEDESFFSLCSRQHFFWANSSPQQTLALLFERNVATYSHDFPRNLSSLNKSAISAWGSAEEIIDEHTIAPIFFPFQSPEHVLAHKKAMKGENLGPIKYKLGLITGRFGGEHPLKACNECIISDRRTHGVAYWHLSHQRPGVTICPIHNCLLRESKENRQWSRAFSWLIPSESILIESEYLAFDNYVFEALKNVSDAATKLGKLGGRTRHEPELVAQVYDAALVRLGTSRSEKDAAAKGFAHHCSMLRKHPQFSSLPDSVMCAIAFTSQMTRKPRGYCHPLKHLVLISWLFGSIEVFIRAYEHQARQRANIKTNELPKMERHKAKQCITAKTVIHTPKPKPKKMFEEVKNKVLHTLRSGTPKAEVCLGFGISISTVNRLLRLNPTIEAMRNEGANVGKIEQQRKQWDLAVDKNPGLCVNKIRRLIPNIYAWLYRNDKVWLSKQAMNLPSGRPGNNSKIDWKSRDEDLCTKIKNVIIQQGLKSVHLRKYDLYQLVPGLYSALESKQHYPKTRALLGKVTQSTSHVRP